MRCMETGRVRVRVGRVKTIPSDMRWEIDERRATTGIALSTSLYMLRACIMGRRGAALEDEMCLRLVYAGDLIARFKIFIP